MGVVLMMFSFYQPSATRPPRIFSCKYCGEVELYWSTVKSPRGAPLPLSVQTKQYHNCELAPWNLEQKAKLRVAAYKKGAIRNIEDFELIDKAQLEVAHINNRLAYYNLRLEVKQTRPLPEEES